MENVCTKSLCENIINTGDVRVMNINPVIKISPQGILLYANSTGIDFLEMLSDYIKTPALAYLLKQCPEILEEDCSLDICCKIYDMKYYFSVVAFKQAGYVGMYGYRLVHTHPKGNLMA